MIGRRARWGGEGRVAQEQPGERDVVGGWSDEGGGPVQDADPVTVTEEVERVEVAVAEHQVALRGRLASQGVEGVDQVLASGSSAPARRWGQSSSTVSATVGATAWTRA